MMLILESEFNKFELYSMNKAFLSLTLANIQKKIEYIHSQEVTEN